MSTFWPAQDADVSLISLLVVLKQPVNRQARRIKKIPHGMGLSGLNLNAASHLRPAQIWRNTFLVASKRGMFQICFVNFTPAVYTAARKYA